MRRIADLHVMDKVIITRTKTHEKKQGVILSIRYDRACERVIICTYAEDILLYKNERLMSWYVSFGCTLEEYRTETTIEGWNNSDYVLNSEEKQQLQLF